MPVSQGEEVVEDGVTSGAVTCFYGSWKWAGAVTFNLANGVLKIELPGTLKFNNDKGQYILIGE